MVRIGQVYCAASSMEAALADLVRSELVFRRGTLPDPTYSFKHALVRDAAYSSMLYPHLVRARPVLEGRE